MDGVKLTVDTLRYCEESGARCGECPSGVDEKGIPICHSQAHIADLIESLAAELEQVKRERDAAVEDVAKLKRCEHCRGYEEFLKPDGNIERCNECEERSHWQWRGVKKED